MSPLFTLGKRKGHGTADRRRKRLYQPTFMGLEDRMLMSAGDLDPSFGINGLRIEWFPNQSLSTRAVAVQSDGKIVVAGRADNQFFVARFNPDGGLDTGFGAGGESRVKFSEGIDTAESIAIQQDGKIVLAGVTSPASGGSDFALARLDPGGTPDTSFGTGGKTTVPFDDIALGRDHAWAVSIQPGGKIVAAGSVERSQDYYGIGVIRLDTNGVLDTSFAYGGYMSFGYGQGVSYSPSDAARAMVIQPDGRILVAGRAANDMAAVRFDSNGMIDGSFGVGGVKTVHFTSPGSGDVSSWSKSVALEPDGKIVLGGLATVMFQNYYAAARLNPDGSLDGGFGVGGMVDVSLSPPGTTSSFDQLAGLAVQDDGKVLLGGWVAPPGVTGLSRLNADGTIDTGFGTGGKVFTDAAGKFVDPGAMVLQADGKLLYAGSLPSGSDQPAVVLARYLPGTPAPTANHAPTFVQGADQVIDASSGPHVVPQWATAISPGSAEEAGQAVTFLVAGDSNPALFATPPSVDPAGTLTYTLAPDKSGVATITLVLKDNGGTDNGGVDTSIPHVFTIAARPLAEDRSFTLDQFATDGRLSVAAAGGLAGPTAAGGSVVLVGGPGSGTLQLNPDGSFVYTPNSDFPASVGTGTTAGVDSFTYKIVNGPVESATRTVTLNVPALRADTLTEAALAGRSYSDQALFDLTHKYVDRYGFVMNRSTDVGSGQPFDDTGDAVIRTSVAAIATALRGDNADTLRFLRAILTSAWNSQGDPIRHPDVFETLHTTSGAVIRQQRPLSQDGISALIAACYYAYTSSAGSSEVRQTARDLIVKLSDYLIVHQWRLYSSYPLEYFEKDQGYGGGIGIEPKGTKFKNVYDAEDRKQLNYLGPETFVLAPETRYQLRDVAAAMGVSSVTWDIMQGVNASLNQQVADFVAGQVGVAVNGVLLSINALGLSRSYSVNLGPLLPPIEGKIDLTIPTSDRDRFVQVVEEAVRTYARADNLISFQLPEIVGAAVDQAFGDVLSLLGGDAWKEQLTHTLGQVLPWLNGDALREVAWFHLQSAQLSSKFDGKLEAEGFYLQHLYFWSALGVMETRPELVDLLRPAVAQLDQTLLPNEMALYAWLDKGPTDHLVGRLTDAFQTDPRYDWLEYSWQTDHTNKQAELFPSAEHGDHRGKWSPRIDYLVLQGLVDHGLPRPLGAVVGDWRDKLGSSLGRARDLIAEQVRAAWNAEGRYTRQFFDAAGRLVRETWDKTGTYIRQTFEHGQERLRQTFVNGKETLRQTYVNGVETLRQRFANGKETVRNTFANGKEVLRNTFTDGKETLRQTFANGVETLRQRFASGKETLRQRFANGREVLRHTFVNGREVLRQTFANGREVLRQKFANGWETLRQEFVNGSEALRHTWDSARNYVMRESWAAGGKFVRSLFRSGAEYQRQTFQNGALTIRQSWDTAGKYTQETWDKAGRYSRRTWDKANRLVESIGSVPGSLVQGLSKIKLPSVKVGLGLT